MATVTDAARIQYDAVIFDMDGVVTDTASAHAWKQAFGELDEVGTVVSRPQAAGFEARHVESLRGHYALTRRACVANLGRCWTGEWLKTARAATMFVADVVTRERA